MLLIELLIIGLLAGYLAGFLGIGGGFVVVPALTYLFLHDPATAPWAIHMAVGTNLVTHISNIYLQYLQLFWLQRELTCFGNFVFKFGEFSILKNSVR